MCNSTNCFRRQLQRQQLQLTCNLRKKSYQCNYFLSKDLGTHKVCFQIEKVFDIVLQRADWTGVFCIRSVTSRIQKSKVCVHIVDSKNCNEVKISTENVLHLHYICFGLFKILFLILKFILEFSNDLFRSLGG